GTPVEVQRTESMDSLLQAKERLRQDQAPPVSVAPIISQPAATVPEKPSPPAPEKPTPAPPLEKTSPAPPAVEDSPTGDSPSTTELLLARKRKRPKRE
ncbi:MAG: hypothetical protein OEZ02_04415, partial [Anaerolineae bacterium]|nr:hypothetical protein [Anaerolineae bacterium]